MELLNVTRYYPEGMPQAIQFFRSEKGEDFYDSIPLFTKRHKLCVRPADGVIIFAHENVARLYPNGFNVHEVDSLPEDFDIDARWRFEDGQIVAPVVDYAARKQKAKLMSAANAAITPLQDAADLGVATDEETARLTTWKQYRVALNRVDLNAPDWPEQPV